MLDKPFLWDIAFLKLLIENHKKRFFIIAATLGLLKVRLSLGNFLILSVFVI